MVLYRLSAHGGSSIMGSTRIIPIFAAILLLFSISTASAGEAEINSARDTITRQLRAFLSNDGPLAYSYAAPNIKSMFPTVGSFMKMVTDGYQPVRNPQSYTFGRTREVSPTRIMQEMLITGPDGKNYSAIYTLELQADGVFRITSVILQPAAALST
jgi:hypothetical protein